MMPCSNKMRCRAKSALPPVHGEVREGVCPSESPAGITKLSQTQQPPHGAQGRTEEQTKGPSLLLRGAMSRSRGRASG